MREVTKVGFQRTTPSRVALTHGLTTPDQASLTDAERGVQPRKLRALLGGAGTDGGESTRSDGLAPKPVAPEGQQPTSRTLATQRRRCWRFPRSARSPRLRLAASC